MKQIKNSLAEMGAASGRVSKRQAKKAMFLRSAQEFTFEVQKP
jgi:hypothetical protein